MSISRKIATAAVGTTFAFLTIQGITLSAVNVADNPWDRPVPTISQMTVSDTGSAGTDDNPWD